MKKITLLFLVSLFFISKGRSQYVDLNDDQFRTFLLNKYPSCFNASLQLDTTCSLITNEDSLEFHGMWLGQQVSPYIDYRTVHYFSSLQYLDCRNNDFYPFGPYIIVFPQSLAHLVCSGLYVWVQGVPPIDPSTLPAGLQYLDYDHTDVDFGGALTVWPAGLKRLDLSYGRCGSLGTLPPMLDTLICNNQNTNGVMPTLSNLGTLPSALRYLNCSNNGLTALPSLPNTLTWLDCSNNFTVVGPGNFVLPVLTSLPALPASLTHLNCNHNALISLPTLPASLDYLDCSANKYYVKWYWDMQTYQQYDYRGIDNLPLLPSLLKYLDCSENNLTSVQSLPATLVHLNIAGGYVNGIGGTPSLPGNQIASLPTLPATLSYFNCGSNSTLTCIPHLPASMSGQSAYTSETYNLFIGGTQVNCIPNTVPGMRLFGQWPLCNQVNNTNACDISPVISGNIFYDNNSNGTQDPGELPRANVAVNFSNGLQAFSDVNGYYEGTADMGSNTVTIDAPTYYNAVPATFTHSIVANNTVVTDLVALQPNVSIDSLKITITPWGNPRPGFSFSYHVTYENVGTTVLNSNVVINYENSKLVFNGVSNAAVIDNGSTLNLALNNFSPGQTGSFTANFTINVAAILGDFIHGIATISGGTDVCIDSTQSMITGSYDPNDKQATPSLTVSQVSSGNFINYLIRFQNTGIANALNVFITDTLSAMLQENTMQMIGASHPCKITRSGNKILCEFLNINLPAMGSNEPESHGYVRFRIKPQPSLIQNTIVINKASIYFDFNVPVLTGDAATIIDLDLVPVKLSSFTVKKQDATVQLYWTTEQEINSKYFIIERSTDQRVWNEMTRLGAAGNSSSARYYTATDFDPAKGINYYRLKQVDLDGMISYSEIRSVYFGTYLSVLIAPNPASDKFNIYLPGNTSIVAIQIFNMSGQLVKTVTTAEDCIQINLSGFSKGMYTVQVKGKNMNEERKLMVE